MSFVYFGIVFVACILQGITGFGFAVLAAPLGLLVLDHQSVIVSLAIVSLMLNLYLAKTVKTQVDKEITYELIVAGLIGVPLGVVGVTLLSNNLVKLITGILAVVFAVLLLTTKRKFHKNPWLTRSIGFLTGVLQSSIGLSGPPVVMMLVGYGLDQKVMRKCLAILFFCLSLATLLLYGWNKFLDFERVGLGILMIPMAVFGGWLGNAVSAKISKKMFRLLILMVVLVAAVQMIAKVFGK